MPARSSGLHAKFLAVEHGWDVSWFVGSANLTYSAFTGRNVEVMAALGARKGRRNGKSGYGIERFLESGFEKLCEPYCRGEAETVLPETEEALERQEAVRDALLDADLGVVCSPAGENWTWSLEGDASLPKSDVEVRGMADLGRRGPSAAARTPLDLDPCRFSGSPRWSPSVCMFLSRVLTISPSRSAFPPGACRRTACIMC